MSRLEAEIESYVAHASSHGKATVEGDYEQANRHHDAIVACLKNVRTFGEGGRSALLELLDHPDEAVRLWAATHSLDYSEEASIRALEALAQGPGIHAFTASVVLDEWRKGTLVLP